MRFLFASTGLGALSALIASPAAADTVISTAVTTPQKTSVAGAIQITAAGSVKATGGAAVTIDSNNTVANAGTIAIKGANNATGILANTNFAGDITNSGTITIDEDFTPTDSDSDGDLDGPFAQGNNRFGIHVLGGGTYTGNILNSGTITVEGNQSAGIAVDSVLTGSLTSTGKVTVTGNDSVGIRTTAVSGNVTIGTGSNTSAQGEHAVGVLLGGDVGGAVVINGAINATGYRSTVAPADPSKLDADDLLQGGSALVVGGNVGGGVLVDTAAAITSFGAAPAVVIGSATQDVTLGVVPTTSLGLVIKGTVKGNGVYQGVNATGLSIGGTGNLVNVAGGMFASGSISSSAVGANATAIHIGSGATANQMFVVGNVSADGAGTSGSAAQGILIDSGATVQAIYNAGTIVATRSGTDGTAAAIVDHSGTLSLVQNSGQLGVTNASDIGDNATAIDLRATTTGAVVRQIAPSSGTVAPLIQGNILFGTGNDTLDIQAGNVIGNVDFGGGSNLLSLGGTSVLRGSLLNSTGLVVTLGTGSTLDANNLGTVNLASLTTAAGANLGVTIGTDGHTLYNVAGAATFGADNKILVTLDHVGGSAGTYTILDAGTLTGAENLTDTIVTLPFLFNSHLTSDAANGKVVLDVELKNAGELGLNKSETAIVDAALDAADLERPFTALFLSTDSSASLKSTLQQLMPEHAGGAFEAATKGSRLTTGVLSDPRRLNGIWLEQVAWGSSKSIGDTASYKIDGWGAATGFDHSLGPVGNIGLTASYLYGKDSKGANELISNHYEGGVYWRASAGPFNAWARATAGTVDFDSTRNFSAVTSAGTLTRSASGKWKGRLYSATGGLSYEARTGRLSIRPNASIEYYRFNEKGYSESGGGDAFDLTVRSRKSKETAANAILTLGYDLMGMDADSTWMRVELEGGRREILIGSIGHTTASFKDGNPFTLEAEDRTSGWRGAARVLGGGTALSVAAEVDAEEQQSKASLGGRVSVSLSL